MVCFAVVVSHASKNQLGVSMTWVVESILIEQSNQVSQELLLLTWLYVLTLILALISYYIQYVWNGDVISSHTLLDVWLRIHAGIKVKPCQEEGPWKIRGLNRMASNTSTHNATSIDAELRCVIDVSLNKPLRELSRCRWFEIPWCSLWRHCSAHT